MTATAQTLIEFANKTQRWMRARPLMLDIALALLLFVVELVDLLSGKNDATREPDVLATMFVAAGALTLVWRRYRPVEAFIVLTLLMAVFYQRGYGSYMSIVGLAGFYAVAAHAKNRRNAWITIAVCTTVLLVAASDTLFQGPDGFDYPSAASMIMSICVVVFVGVVARNHEQIFRQAEARADEAEADRAAAAERARDEERLRIARELHDVVAHGMSVISVQAAAAQEIAATDPERAVELMRTVETTGRESLNEMRRMLGVLRNRQGTAESPGDVRGPQPSLADIETTIEHCRDAGLATSFVITGEERPIPPGLELAVFRIVQEALTNALKHGGASATASVELTYRSTTLCVSVADTGRGAVAGLSGTGAGNGLVGMRERVELYEGTLTTGPEPGGGYRVTAVLPLEPVGRPRVVSAESQPTGQPS